MNSFIKIRQILSLDKVLFAKIKKDMSDGDSAPKRFWLFAESLGEFRLALYIVSIISNMTRDDNKKI